MSAATSPSSLASAPSAGLAAEAEQQLIAIITRPREPHEEHRRCAERRVADLRAVFASLAPLPAYIVRCRLVGDRGSDELAVAFRRLTVERRNALIAFLGSPRRHLG